MGEENKQLSVAQIKAIIEERNIWPWQVFTEEQIRNDRQYGKAYHEIDNLKKEVEQLKTAHTEKEKTIKEYGEKEKNLQLATYRQNAKDRSKRMLQLQNATDAQIKFFELKFSPNEMNLEDLTDEALQKKINSVLAERQKLAAAGIIKDEQSLPPKDDKKGEQPKQPVDKNDLTKAENNELLTEDLT